MSLHKRLTLWSAIVLVALFALFGAISVLSVRYFLYKTIDDQLERETTADLVQILRRQTRDLSRLRDDQHIGIVFYTVYDTDGQVVWADRSVPINDQLFADALAGGAPKSTETLPDGTQVRVLLKRIALLETGEVVGVLQAAAPLDFTDQVLTDLTRFLVATSAALLVLAAIGSHILTGRALRAVGAITRKAHNIELSQDLSQRIPDPGTEDELGHLARTFNRMLSRLQLAFDAQRRFVADSSHELRTPLTVIRSNLHLLARAADPGERAQLIGSTEAEVSRLGRMVNDLLYMAQMQAGQDLSHVRRPVELDTLLLEVFAKARALAALKGQRVQLANEAIASTVGDADQLQHLLLNLVDNAVKYTPEGGTISLGLWNDGDWARIEVSDDGPGIAPEDLPYIFDRFYRSQRARQTHTSGSGLGLAIVKSIVEAHGGRVEVASHPGKGTTFRVWLRASRAAPIVLDDGREEPEAGALPVPAAAGAGEPRP